MKLKPILSCLAAVLFSAAAASAATLADWTFETSAPTTAGPFSPEIGSGSATGFHVGAAVYSSPAGNGSAHCFSSTLWAVGDYYQFQVSTIGAQNVNVSYDQTSSNTGPGNYALEYSIDGIHFTVFGVTNTVLANAAPNTAWSASGAVQTNFNFSYNLSSITALNNISTVYFRVVNVTTTSANGGTTATGGTDRIDNFVVVASTATPPAISGITPSTLTTNAGNTVAFTVTLSTGDSPLTYFWYKGANLISAVTSSSSSNTLILPNVLAANAGTYQVVVSNAFPPTATSSASLTVLDPAINLQPVSQTGLLNGEVQFPVTAGGTGLTYKWYFCADPSDNTQITGAVSHGTQPSGSIVSGETSSTLTITNLQASDPTNFVVVVTDASGSITSSVASLAVANTAPLAFWNFNGAFNVTNPATYQGIGTASATNVTPFSQPANDADDPMSPTTAWGTENYPAQGTLNTNAGVQFNTSTVGAKNVMVSYDARATGTASKYHRLQYTTNGTDFIDYPTSSSIVTAGTATSGYITFNYNLTGFQGVANNPSFGIRLVTEFENTATYGNTNDADYAAVGNTDTYGPGGTLSYDLVDITADAITDANTPPTVAAIANQTMADGGNKEIDFAVNDSQTPSGLTATATCLTPSVSLGFSSPIVGGTCHLIISSSMGNVQPVTVPILVTVSDGEDSTVTWFYLTITAANTPPVFGGLMNTNMLGSTSLTIPFTLSDDHTDPATITPTVLSANTTLVSNDVAHVSLGGSGANRTLTITPVTNQFGTVPITVSASDGSLSSSKTIYVTVRPNTNVVLVDNFTYDGASGPLITLSEGFWQTHSGAIPGQLLESSSGIITVDGVNNTEDVNAQLVGAPYLTNSGAVLYSRYVINYTQMPDATGSYFGHFKDNTTFGFLARVWAFSNSPTSYQLGIANSTSTSASAVPFPQNLVLNSNYVVVTRLVLSNSFSTVWINPTSESSPSVTDTTDITTNTVNIYAYAFRESTADEGILTVSNMTVGLSFAAVTGIVTPAQLKIQTIGGGKAVLSWTDSTFSLQAAPTVTGTYTNVPGSSSPYTNNITDPAKFYRLIH